MGAWDVCCAGYGHAAASIRCYAAAAAAEGDRGQLVLLRQMHGSRGFGQTVFAGIQQVHSNTCSARRGGPTRSWTLQQSQAPASMHALPGRTFARGGCSCASFLQLKFLRFVAPPAGYPPLAAPRWHHSRCWGCSAPAACHPGDPAAADQSPNPGLRALPQRPPPQP